MPSIEKKIVKKRKLTFQDYIDGVLKCDRAIIGQTITLVESSLPEHVKIAGKVLDKLSSKAGDSLRIGITGVPGVGKSTFIEALGLYLIGTGKRVAVLAIDPSSTITGGSILGDKTRMENLAKEENCFIRPTPAAGTLGGVAGSTMETILICEAAGYDIIFVETVGVGQSEVAVRDLTDLFMLLMLPNAGDSLQGIKRGIMELADIIVINKADRENQNAAIIAKKEIEQALGFMRPATLGWNVIVETCSALYSENIQTVWSKVNEFWHNSDIQISESFKKRRLKKVENWLMERLDQRILTAFYSKEDVINQLPKYRESFLKGETSLEATLEKVLKLNS